MTYIQRRTVKKKASKKWKRKSSNEWQSCAQVTLRKLHNIMTGGLIYTLGKYSDWRCCSFQLCGQLCSSECKQTSFLVWHSLQMNNSIQLVITPTSGLIPSFHQVYTRRLPIHSYTRKPNFSDGGNFIDSIWDHFLPSCRFVCEP